MFFDFSVSFLKKKRIFTTSSLENKLYFYSKNFI